ncbi:thylakoid lumenal 15 kDa protein 1, chloroplastic [Hordeum vulgare]|nr:thylakoid lumenal 15 kDa protein 1, chloroplastic [Hordeum vulgare]
MAMTILGALKLAPSPPATTTSSLPAWRGPSSLHFHLAKAGAAALVAASLLVADPALAFRVSPVVSVYLSIECGGAAIEPALMACGWTQGGGPYGQQVTRGQDLTGKDFSGQTLIKQDFKTSILRQTNFKGANLLGASFFDADLTGADLSDADLRNADFSLANVTKVNLTNANLEGALVTGNTSFKGSNIYGADFTDVPLRDDQRDYLCKIADGVNTTTGNATKETLFCK